MAARPNNIPKDAVLLIPDPEDENTPAPYGIAPGYYNPKQLLELLDQHRHNADAVHFIADMLEAGNPKDDGFAQLLRAHHADPAAIARIVKGAGE
jgi:hypothetical protein